MIFACCFYLKATGLTLKARVLFLFLRGAFVIACIVSSSPRKGLVSFVQLAVVLPVAPVAQRYHVTSDTLGREFDPGKRDFSH